MHLFGINKNTFIRRFINFSTVLMVSRKTSMERCSLFIYVHSPLKYGYATLYIRSYNEFHNITPFEGPVSIVSTNGI